MNKLWIWLILTAPACAQSPEQWLERAERWLDLSAPEHARQALARVQPRTPQQRFDYLLLQERWNSSQIGRLPELLDQAARIAPAGAANRLRLQLRRFTALPDPSEQSRVQWQKLTSQWQNAPVPALACEYHLTQSFHFRNLEETRAELNALEEARRSARRPGERLRVSRAMFSYYLNHDQYDQAEQELLAYGLAAGRPGVAAALTLQAQLAQRRDRRRLAQSLYCNAAELEAQAGETRNELTALLGALMPGEDLPAVRARARKIVRALPDGGYKLTQLLQLTRLPEGQQLWPEVLALWPRLQPSEQRRNFQFCQFRLREAGMTRQALVFCNRALSQDPDWPVALLAQGELLQAEGQADAALECYQRALSHDRDLNERDVAHAASSLIALLHDQHRDQELFPICQKLLAQQSDPRGRATLLRSGLMGRGPGDSVAARQFHDWCWQQLNDLIPQLNPAAQLDFLQTLTYRPPSGARLAPVIERGLELSSQEIARWLQQENWDRYARSCMFRASLLRGASRRADALECLLEADRRLSQLPRTRSSILLLEQLVWIQEGSEAEASALRLLPELRDADRRCEIWLKVALLRQAANPEGCLQAFAQALQAAPDESTRWRVLNFQARVLEDLKRWPEVIQLLAPLRVKGQEALVRCNILSRAYRQTGQLDQAEVVLREALQQTSAESGGERVQQLLDLVDLLREKHSPEAETLLLQGYQSELAHVSGNTRWRLLRSYVRLLLDQGRSQQALQVLEQEKFPSESLADLKSRPELADWLASRPGPAPPSDSVADFRESLVKIRSLRHDLDSHPFFQADRVELLQRHLGPRQLLLAFCPAGPQMLILGVDRQRTYVAEFSLEGDWFSQQLTQIAKNSQARSYVSSRLLTPIEGWLREKDVLLVPLAEGWYVPWEVLGAEPLGTSHLCTRVSSTDLLHLAAGDWQPFQLSDSLALGAPPEAGLDGARRELEDLARRLPQCRLALGEQARLEALREPASLMHLASHSVIVGNDPDASFLQLAQARLSLREIYQLKLKPHSLVVLSSCSSARGQTHPQGEPLSLAQAFAAAGSQTEISALWPVDDEATALFFEIFYQSLSQGGSPAQSLLEARRGLAAKGFGPSDWAAFVLQGCPD